MRQAILGVIASLLLGTGSALAQDPCAACPSACDADPACGEDASAPEATSCVKVKGEHGSGLWPIECDLSCVHWMVGADFLYWRLRPTMPETPLFTISAGQPIPGRNGSLGQSTTRVVGNEFDADNGYQAGLRLRGGIAVETEGGAVGIEGSCFRLWPFETEQGPITVPTGNTLARPVVDVRTGQETVLFVQAPNQFSGSGALRTSTRLQGADVSASYWPEGYFYSLLGGFTYLSLRDELDIEQNSTILTNGLLGFLGRTIRSGASVSITDTFQTRNHFYGSHVGLRIDNTTFSPLHLEMVGKVSLGETCQEVTINGTTRGSGFAPPNTAPGGALALASNIGSFSQNHFSVVPEVGFNLGVDMGPVRFLAGYSFLYWSNVIRASSEVDRTINPLFLPTSVASFNPSATPRRPMPLFSQQDLFVHGLNVGLEISY